MNTRKTASRCWQIALASSTLAVSLMGGASQAAEFWLCAKTTTLTMPGTNEQVAMWGYALDSLNFGGGCTAAASIPGPALDVPVGDTSLTIHLRNVDVPEGVSVVIPGQVTTMAPVMATDALGRSRVHSFAAEATSATATTAAVDQTYMWNGLKPGTFLYHSGSHPQIQVQMGLYGAVTHDAALGEAYPGVAYANSVTLLYSEIDPVLHAAVAAGSYGTATAPNTPGCFDILGQPTTLTSTICYAPKYFLVNGMPYTATTPPIIGGGTGQATLLRFINAGLKTHVPMLQGLYMKAVAEDGNLYPYARNQYSAFLPAGKTMDALVTPVPGEEGTYSIYDRRLYVSDALHTNGGMFSKISFGVTAGAPVAANDPNPADPPYAIDEDALLPLAVAAPGVLANDTAGTGPTTTASLVSGPSHGTLTLNADGSFSYSPFANYNGADSFSYRAMSGGLASNTATVSLTVNPVNDAPVAVNNAYNVNFETTRNVAAPGVLGNDSDVDGNPLTVAVAMNVTNGILTLNANGSFSYTPNAGFSGTDSFTYIANDGTGTVNATSNAATVKLTVLANQAPLARNDVAKVSKSTRLNPTSVTIPVLANDRDVDGTLDPASVAIVVVPNKGGTAVANPDGTITYSPRVNFVGSESFRYTVRDNHGLQSNRATVKVNVR